MFKTNDKPYLIPVLLTTFSIFLPMSVTALTKQEAYTRSQQVSDVEYKIELNLTQSGYNPIEDSKEIAVLPIYDGKVDLQFKAASNLNTSQEVFLDFTSQDDALLKSVILNGKPIEVRWDKAEHKIFLPTAELKLGEVNDVQITFSNRFTRNGKGFHRALDQEDKEIYLYTHNEPFYANELFPMFDQPDLKAHFQLETEVPSSWEVVSNTREIEKNNIDSNNTKWTFARTEKFSTYIFMLAAGPFQVWTPKIEDEIPLRLFARKSLAKYVDADDWLNITKESFRFYEEKFGKYAFHKYDQIIVPEFYIGAMENVGAVTYSERYLSRGKMTPLERTSVASVIAHEMAHMWFGDLVTMKWWDDLWLKESFATFSSALALEGMPKSLGLLNAWQDFYDDKKWAYETDEYHTTHPIVGTVNNTDVALTVFDGITYGKGSAVLKQLYFYIGKENYFKGVRNYLNHFKFQNATRADFMNELSSASGINLEKWDEDWLRTSGTNELQVSLTEKNGKIEKLVLTPVADPMDNKYRDHRTQVGLYDFNAEGKIVLTQMIPVTYQSEPVEISSIIGVKVPVFIFTNVEDFDFTREVLNSRNLEQIKLHLAQIEDPLLKQQIYLSLRNMLKSGEISARDLVDVLIKNSLEETNSNLLKDLFTNLGTALIYAQADERQELNEQISDFLFQKMNISQKGSAEQENVFRNFLAFTRSSKNVDQIVAWLNGTQILDGMQFTQDDRWRFIIALAANNYPGAEHFIQAESLKDKSNLGQLKATIARIKIPGAKSKQEWFKEITTPGKFNAADSRSIAQSLHDVLNESLTEFVETQYFDALRNLIRSNDDTRKIADLASALYPLHPSNVFISKASEFVNNENLSSQLKHNLLNCIEDSIRIQKALEKIGKQNKY